MRIEDGVWLCWGPGEHACCPASIVKSDRRREVGRDGDRRYVADRRLDGAPRCWHLLYVVPPGWEVRVRPVGRAGSGVTEAVSNPTRPCKCGVIYEVRHVALTQQAVS